MTYMLEDWRMWVGIVFFISFIILDAWKAKQRGAFWLPGNVLALCGLALQLFASLDSQNVSFSGKARVKDLELLIANQLLIDSTRLTLCIFVAYLLPAMASIAYKGLWTTVAAVFISVCSYISIEFVIAAHFYSTQKSKAIRNQSHVLWLIASGPFLLFSILGLVFLVGWAILNGKFIRDSFNCRIPIILSENNVENEGHSWDSFKTEVLKSWILARVCQPDYVLSRSAFGAGVGVGVIFCVAFLGIKIICLRSLLNGGFTLFIFHCIFILLGWIVILYRWFRAVYYLQIFRESLPNPPVGFLAAFRQRYSELHDIHHVFLFRLRHLVKISTDMAIHQLPNNAGIRILQSVLMVFILPFWYGLLVIVVVSCMVIMMSMSGLMRLSIFCWVMSGLGVDNKFIRSLCKVDSKLQNSLAPDGAFWKYRVALNSVRMPGEDALSLWKANEDSFNDVNIGMDEAYKTGGSCKELIQLLEKFIAANHHRRFVDELREPLGSVKKYFPRLKEPLWRMTALSLLKIIMEAVPYTGYAIPVENAMRAYKQANDFMGFADCTDNVDINVDLFGTSNVEAFLVSSAADREIPQIEESYKRWKLKQRISTRASDVESALYSIRKLFHCAAQTLEDYRLLGEASIEYAVCADWEEVAESYTDYKVCNIILDLHIKNVKELVGILLDFFAEVIASSMLELPDLLLKSSREWAAEFREEKIYLATKTAGKAWGVIDAAKNFRETNRGPAIGSIMTKWPTSLSSFQSEF